MFVGKGSVVAGYTLLEKIGQGTFGTVFSCEAADGDVVVMKMMDVSLLSARDREACLTEIKVLATLASLDCEYIIRYEDSFLEESTLCVIMEYAGGGNLLQKIRSSKSGLPDRTLWTVFTQVALALHRVHNAGILHRDLKSANIFLTPAGDARLGDFGLSKVLSHPSSLAKSVVGTPYYLSPEMCNGKEYNSMSDIWALGVVLYEMATASFPFEASNQAALVLQIMRCKISNREPIVKKYGTAVWELIAACLKKNPAHRPSLTQLLAHPRLMDRAQAYGVALPKEVEEEYRRQVVREIRAHPVDSVASAAPPSQQPARGAAAAPSQPMKHPQQQQDTTATLAGTTRPPPPQPGMIPSRRVRRGAPRAGAPNASTAAASQARRVPTALRQQQQHMDRLGVGAGVTTRPFTPHLHDAAGAGAATIARSGRVGSAGADRSGPERLYYQSRPPPPEPPVVHTSYKSKKARQRDITLVAGLPEMESSDDDDDGSKPRARPAATSARGSGTSSRGGSTSTAASTRTARNGGTASSMLPAMGSPGRRRVSGSGGSHATRAASDRGEPREQRPQATGLYHTAADDHDVDDGDAGAYNTALRSGDATVAGRGGSTSQTTEVRRDTEGDEENADADSYGSYTDNDNDAGGGRVRGDALSGGDDDDGEYSDDPDFVVNDGAAGTLDGAVPAKLLMNESCVSRTSYAEADEFVDDATATGMGSVAHGVGGYVGGEATSVSVSWTVKGGDGRSETTGVTETTNGFAWGAGEDIETPVGDGDVGAGGAARGGAPCDGDREAALLEQLLAIEKEIAKCGHDESTLVALNDMLEMGESVSSVPEMTQSHVVAVRLLYRRMMVEAELKEFDKLSSSH